MKIHFFAAALAILSVLAPSPASAQYPAKPVKLIVPYPPGGPVDNVGRIIAQQLSKGLGQPVVVENRPGAAGTIGAEAVANSPGDGYTLLLGTTGTLASAPVTNFVVVYDKNHRQAAMQSWSRRGSDEFRVFGTVGGARHRFASGCVSARAGVSG